MNANSKDKTLVDQYSHISDIFKFPNWRFLETYLTRFLLLLRFRFFYFQVFIFKYKFNISAIYKAIILIFKNAPDYTTLPGGGRGSRR